MALRQIMNFKTDDILRKKSRPVEIIDSKVRTLIKDMAETMYHAEGAGLAAPQVGILKRIIVIDVGEGLTALINPVITEISGEQQAKEGCLSIPGLYGVVKRPERVTLEALNEKGETIELEGTGLLARAFCHEIDHLDGILYIDKVIPGTLEKQEDSI